MKLLLAILLVLCTTHSLGQQQTAPPEQRPPGMPSQTTPGTEIPNQQIPPDTKAPMPGELSSPDIEKQLQKELSRNPVLSQANLKAIVDDQNVVLSGTVENTRQHDLAVQLAQSYAGRRKIVDKIMVRQKI
jgi:osmotically-inducible protein OsmY